VGEGCFWIVHRRLDGWSEIRLDGRDTCVCLCITSVFYRSDRCDEHGHSTALTIHAGELEVGNGARANGFYNRIWKDKYNPK
jgi:hypothetical protein